MKKYKEESKGDGLHSHCKVSEFAALAHQSFLYSSGKENLWVKGLFSLSSSPLFSTLASERNELYILEIFPWSYPESYFIIFNGWIAFLHLFYSIGPLKHWYYLYLFSYCKQWCKKQSCTRISYIFSSISMR